MNYRQKSQGKRAKNFTKTIAIRPTIANMCGIDSQYSKLRSLSMRKVVALAVAGMVAFAANSAMAEGDAKKGEKVFKKCKACHSLEEGKHKVGPSLAGIIGRSLGAAEGFTKYSDDYKKLAAASEGFTWTSDELKAYLTHPSKYLAAKLDVKKAKSGMAFKLKKEKDRNNIIAYFESLQ